MHKRCPTLLAIKHMQIEAGMRAFVCPHVAKDKKTVIETECGGMREASQPHCWRGDLGNLEEG